MQVGYHASHEQFPPSELVALARHAEQAGFSCIKSSDHFHPWSERQGQSGFAWSWLGAAMQATQVPFGIISAPSYRYHPAVLAQAAATIGEMFPKRLWLALGSGEAINEAMTGLPWPEKAERNARLLECAQIIQALFAGETVTQRGRVTVIEAKLYSRPLTPVPILAAAATEATAQWAGSWAEGLLTTGGEPAAVRRVVEAFRAGGGTGKPVYLQAALSWAPTADEAMAQALDQWGPAAVGGEVNWDLRRPADFDRVGQLVTAESIRECVHVSHDLGVHRAWLEQLGQFGVDSIYLHQVGRHQRAFIDAFAGMLPQLAG